jgi:mannose-6-phosphate isomerase-like protein (cupin superfamily)
MRAKRYTPRDLVPGRHGSYFEDLGIHEKGWGHELWIANNDLYCGKILHIKKGKMCSLHFHMDKDETMYLQSGHLQLRFKDPETGEEYTEELLPGDAVRIRPGMVHQIGALEDSDLFEFSTRHYDTDSFRIEKGD